MWKMKNKIVLNLINNNVSTNYNCAHLSMVFWIFLRNILVLGGSMDFRIFIRCRRNLLVAFWNMAAQCCACGEYTRTNRTLRKENIHATVKTCIHIEDYTLNINWYMNVMSLPQFCPLFHPSDGGGRHVLEDSTFERILHHKKDNQRAVLLCARPYALVRLPPEWSDVHKSHKRTFFHLCMNFKTFLVNNNNNNIIHCFLTFC